MSYQPPAEILQKYADVLVNYALGGGTGVQKGQVVMVSIPECAKALYAPIRDTILRAGAHPLMHLLADEVRNSDYFAIASEAQLDFFPEHYYRGLTEQMDHSINIIAESNKHELETVDPVKMIRRSSAFRPFRMWRDAKESAGKFTWTLALYGTEAMAAEVNMTEEEYWDQIIKACYLDQKDPIAAWHKTGDQIHEIQQKLNQLEIEKLHVESEDADLWVGVGPKRKWLGGGGRNIPSFELFISPDWRGTEGWIRFNQPLYYLSNLIEGVELHFEEGLVTKATATRGEALLKEMIAAENANRIGEYSLTDGRFSHITKFMGETLYDENVGGEQGNTHLALGAAYKDSYTGNPAIVTSEEWADLGFNESVIHTDIISTARRTVTAYLMDGTTKVIYKDGQFRL